jgi:hypothetical protein
MLNNRKAASTLALVLVSQPGFAGEAWTPCASEGETCTVTGATQVRYGANNTFVTRTFDTSVPCSNDTFGDPIVGVPKKCETSVVYAPEVVAALGRFKARFTAYERTEYLPPPCGDAAAAVTLAESGEYVTVTNNQARPLIVDYGVGSVSVTGVVAWNFSARMNMKQGESVRFTSTPVVLSEAGRKYGKFKSYYSAQFMDALWPNGVYDPIHPTACGVASRQFREGTSELARSIVPPAKPPPGATNKGSGY